ncbi:MAG: sensor histidine kinase [Lachnospiraceae bacterium]|nr:sensor histidine kinase [Lachnospiraceae bacterium]
MKKRLLPLQQQLLFLLCMFVVFIFSIIIWSVNDYMTIQRESMDSYLELYSSHMAQTARQSYTSYENIAYSVAYNTLVQDYIQEEDSARRYDSYKKVYNLLNNTAKLNSNLTDIAVISNDGNSISLTASPDLYSGYKETLSAPSYAFQSMGTLTIRDSVCHILSMPVHQLNTTGQHRYLGTVFLAINSQRLFSSDLTPEQGTMPEVLLIDEYGQLIHGNEALFAELPQDITSTSKAVKIDRKTYMARMYTISEAGSRLYILYDSSLYTGASFEVTLRMSIGIGAAMLLILLTFIIVCFPVSHSLRQLTHVMRDITDGEQKTIREGVDLTNVRFGCSEIRDIYSAFNDMLQEINHLNHTIFNTYTQMYELEMNNRQTEIDFLRSQINPHFLYNTLTTICGMSASGMNSQIIDVTNALSRIFRYSIQGGDMVSLSEELDIIRSYLMIQSYRFEDRFGVEYSISNEALPCQIPKMIIQPLVENAIVHGLEPSLKRGKIIISASLSADRDYLTISVMDTGVGMSAEKLQLLRDTVLSTDRYKRGNAKENLQALDAKSHDSIGILNVNSRIVLYYGEEYTLKLDSWAGAGTNIQIRIPCKRPLYQQSIRQE